MSAKTLPDCCHQLGELLGVAQVGGERLVADDVDAALQEGACHGEMHVVGRDDGDRLDAVLQPALAPRHLLERAVAAVFAQPELQAGGLGALRLGGERAGNQLVLVVEPRGDAVHAADEGALSAAHHAEADASGEFFAASFDGHVFSPLRIANLLTPLGLSSRPSLARAGTYDHDCRPGFGARPAANGGLQWLWVPVLPLVRQTGMTTAES